MYIAHTPPGFSHIDVCSCDADKQVGDWGLARSFHDNQRKHTPTVITLWYRPPEVLLRTTRVSQLNGSVHP